MSWLPSAAPCQPANRRLTAPLGASDQAPAADDACRTPASWLMGGIRLDIDQLDAAYPQLVGAQDGVKVLEGIAHLSIVTEERIEIEPFRFDHHLETAIAVR